MPACAWRQSQLPFNDDPLPRIEARRDRRAVALGAGELDLAQLNALILLGNKNVWPALTALDGDRRHADRVRPCGEVNLDIHILTGPELIGLVGERGLGRDGA